MRFTLAQLLLGVSVLAAGGSLMHRHLTREPVVQVFSSWDAGVAEQRRTGKPMFVQFVNITDTISLLNQASVIGTRDVLLQLEDFVVVELYQDKGEDAEFNRRLQRETFGTVAAPFYIIVSPAGEERARLTGVVSKQGFLAFLRRAMGRA
jgi:hypothetical protein